MREIEGEGCSGNSPLISATGQPMPRDGAIIFGDLIGKLGLLRVSCEKCGRDGSYGLGRLIRERREQR